MPPRCIQYFHYANRSVTVANFLGMALRRFGERHWFSITVVLYFEYSESSICLLVSFSCAPVRKNSAAKFEARTWGTTYQSDSISEAFSWASGRRPSTQTSHITLPINVHHFSKLARSHWPWRIPLGMVWWRHEIATECPGPSVESLCRPQVPGRQQI